ncbi:MAG TPA: 7,8-didemethyl-8-hydroxy-5-deazariboflavin synthase subunit CofG, partial [Alphaproteobacteria bacterium]|nr:7,8-didemethyl-8-hydroxy-5-deazariboflavin synthase subunit CofG [Alphaproteobacteria bacterium]
MRAEAMIDDILAAALNGARPEAGAALSLADATDLPRLMAVAAQLRDRGHRNLVSYSRKVFIPLTHLCRDVCHYCTFAEPPRRGEPAFLTPEQVLAIARQGERAGCREALFTLGDKPELRYRAAREALATLGFDSTLGYLQAMAKLVADETTLLPHLNPGLMSAADLVALRPVAASMGIMLESAAPRLCDKGMPHYGSPDKAPAVRLAAIARAGEAAVPFTSGILIGIGETRAERVASLLALRDLHDAHGHLQEVIIQNFRAKPGTKMAHAPEPDLEELLWTIAVARILFGAAMNIQAPPNLSPGVLPKIIDAGINDWGGVSPVTPDFVNPEAPWPHLEDLARETAAAGKLLVERLTVYPAFARAHARWIDPAMRPGLLRAMDSEGFARAESWSPGAETPPPAAILAQSRARDAAPVSDALNAVLARAAQGADLSEAEIVRLFQARGAEFSAVCAAADRLRARMCGDTVSYVVNRNINYTNVCYFKCQFCAFSKGKLSENLRGKPYDLGLGEIVRRAEEAWARGASEVCMQGGIHPDYTGQTYLDICRAVKAALPDMHIHAFSPLEIWQGAATLELSLEAFLSALKEAGLGTLPGTAAETLDDEVRAVLCPDKLKSDEWLAVMAAAHKVGFKTTATIMYGHVEGPEHWARHLRKIHLDPACL